MWRDDRNLSTLLMLPRVLPKGHRRSPDLEDSEARLPLSGMEVNESSFGCDGISL